MVFGALAFGFQISTTGVDKEEEGSKPVPPKVLRGGISKVNFQETLSIFGDKCPQNGSKTAPGIPPHRAFCGDLEVIGGRCSFSTSCRLSPFRTALPTNKWLQLPTVHPPLSPFYSLSLSLSLASSPSPPLSLSS